jgi:GNAT superfamily N-acetyltransferase
MFDTKRGPLAMAKSAMAPVVRTAEPADARAIAIAHIRSWQVGYADVISAELLESLDSDLDKRTLRWSTIILGAGPESHFVLVAELEGKLAGFLSGGPCRDPELENLGEVHGCYVDPDSWRKGVGSALMSEAIARLTKAGHPKAMLWVLADNPRARGFYEHHGWSPDGGHKMFEVGGERYREVRYRRSLA